MSILKVVYSNGALTPKPRGCFIAHRPLSKLPRQKNIGPDECLCQSVNSKWWFVVVATFLTLEPFSLLCIFSKRKQSLATKVVLFAKGPWETNHVVAMRKVFSSTISETEKDLRQCRSRSKVNHVHCVYRMRMGGERWIHNSAVQIHCFWIFVSRRLRGHKCSNERCRPAEM